MLPASIVDGAASIAASTSQDATPDQYFHDGHYHSAVRPTVSTGLPTPPDSSRASIPPTPSENSIVGRKRSRGELHDDGIAPAAAQPDGALANTRGEPVYGPGMTLTYPSDPAGHYAPDATNQSNAWLGEGQEDVATDSSRPVMPTRKSQRMSTSVAASHLPSQSQTHSSERSPGSETVIDEASRMLGISWTRMDQTESLQISQRAYTRWIDRHYPHLSNVEVWFENCAIPGYLGKATNEGTGVEEYYLWSHDLHQAILVTRNPSDLVIKLGQPQLALSQATEKIYADVKSVVEASAANAAIVHNDRFLASAEPRVTTAGSMEID